MLLTKAKVRKAIKRLDVNIMFAILQQFPLGTAAIASYLYPALGRADARNEGGALRALPLAIPHSAENFYENYFLL